MKPEFTWHKTCVHSSYWLASYGCPMHPIDESIDAWFFKPTGMPPPNPKYLPAPWFKEDPE